MSPEFVCRWTMDDDIDPQSQLLAEVPFFFFFFFETVSVRLSHSRKVDLLQQVGRIHTGSAQQSPPHRTIALTATSSCLTPLRVVWSGQVKHKCGVCNVTWRGAYPADLCERHHMCLTALMRKKSIHPNTILKSYSITLINCTGTVKATPCPCRLELYTGQSDVLSQAGQRRERNAGSPYASFRPILQLNVKVSP